jgi:hypothetical protein
MYYSSTLCITAAEIGKTLDCTCLVSILAIAYAMGYALGGFTTFIAILGRYNINSKQDLCSCCSVLGQDYKGIYSQF